MQSVRLMLESRSGNGLCEYEGNYSSQKRKKGQKVCDIFLYCFFIFFKEFVIFIFFDILVSILCFFNGRKVW